MIPFTLMHFNVNILMVIEYTGSVKVYFVYYSKRINNDSVVKIYDIYICKCIINNIHKLAENYSTNKMPCNKYMKQPPQKPQHLSLFVPDAVLTMQRHFTYHISSCF